MSYEAWTAPTIDLGIRLLLRARHKLRAGSLAAPACLLVPFFAASFYAPPAQAQLSVEATQKGCYSIHVDPPTATAVIGERVDFDVTFSQKSECPTVDVTWIYTAVTPALELTLDPSPGEELGVRPLDGAYFRSTVGVEARLSDAVTGEPLKTIGRLISLGVEGGLRLPKLFARFVDRPDQVIAGRPITLTAELSNSGDAGTPIDVVGRLRIDGIDAGDVVCPPLPAGGSCEVSFDLVFDQPGRPDLDLCVDPDDLIEERDDRLFCAGTTFPVYTSSLPDIAVEALVVAPQSPPVDQPTLVTVVSSNIGADASPYTLYLDTPEGTYTQSCPLAPPLNQCSRTFTWYPRSSGLVELTARAVYQGEEASSENNQLTRTITVTGDPARPDFTFRVSDVTMTPVAPRVGDTITFTARMANFGAPWDASWPYTLLSMRTDDGNQGTELTCFEDLAGGAFCEKTITVEARSGGVHTFTAIADSGFSVAESNEQNNSRSLTYVVEDADTGVSCQGLWTLTGALGTDFSTSAPGSVVDGCYVYFGQSSPTGCLQTVGDGGLRAEWRSGPDGSGCPGFVTVADPNPPYQTWHFTISIH